MTAPETTLTPVGPVFLVDRLPALHGQLMALLRGLSSSDWDRPTACALWSVKDIAAHLLDSSLRGSRFTGPAGGVWTLVRAPESWSLFVGTGASPAAKVNLDQEIAWKLFSKGLSPAEAARRITIEGDLSLGQPMLGSLAVMA